MFAKENRVKELVVRNVRAIFENLQCGKGPPTKNERILLNLLSLSVMSGEVKSERLHNTMTQVIGISRLQQNSALSKLQKQTKRSKPVVDAIVTKRKSATTGKFASLTSALEEIVQYFQASQTHLLTRRSLRE